MKIEPARTEADEEGSAGPTSEKTERETTSAWSEAALGPYNYGGYTHPDFGKHQFQSSTSDYALIEIPQSQQTLINAYHYRETAQPGELKTCPVERVAIEMGYGEVHIILGAFNVHSGYMLKHTALFIDRMTVFRTRKIQTDVPLSVGVSGAWVARDAELLGMIIAVYADEPYAHMLPIEDIFSDLRSTLITGDRVPKIDLNLKEALTESTEVPYIAPVIGRDSLEISMVEAEVSHIDFAEKEDKTKGPSVIDMPRDCISGWKKNMLFASLCISRFVVGFDLTMFPTIMPAITDHFHSLDHIGWYGSAYLLGRYLTWPLLTRYFYGRKTARVQPVSGSIFVAGCLCCALAPDSAVMIDGRGLTGCGAAGCLFSVHVLIEGVIPERRPGIARTGLAQIHGLGSMLGPMWCDLCLADLATESYIFSHGMEMIEWQPERRRPRLRSIPVIFDEAEHEAREHEGMFRHLDLASLLVLLAAALFLMFGLQMGASHGWRSATIGLLVLSGAFAGFFVVNTTWTRLGSRLPFRESGLLALLASFWGCSFYAFNHFLPIWFQSVKGRSPRQSGIMYLPTIGGLFITPFVTSSLARLANFRLDDSSQLEKFALFLSLALIALGTGFSSTFDTRTKSQHWIGYQIIVGIGAGVGIDQAIVGTVNRFHREMPFEHQRIPSTFQDVSTRVTVVQLSEGFGGAIAIYAAHTVFLTQLRSTLQPNTSTSGTSFDI
ncbi:hypothetical protein BDV96DRAFT_677252 [Lophiotrema nucula]|uniref:Major facilitator superfamily domain-containing protein n=1 Tax=Lophiotrema nucula TaxID=690887 RepID=A0A6A5YEG0_9PLEO|nr:hypothetical protein BDV96DRAFT_677252 [Lophiotrema nucula]